MTNKEASDKLRTHLKKLKKQKLTPSVVRTIMRVKALIAYYNSIFKFFWKDLEGYWTGVK
jgi:hypothetical protein